MGRKPNDITFKEPVKIREKALKDGNKSLYLDIYMNGNRKKEGLKLYLVPEVNAAARAQNKNTMKLAEQVKAQRILDIQKVGLVDWEKVKKINTTLLDYVDKYVHTDEQLSTSSARCKRNLQTRVKEYLVSINDVTMPLNKVNKEFCKNFIVFLATCTYDRGRGPKPLSSTTQRMFVNRLGTVFENALREGLINQNPMKLLDKKEKPKKDQVEKEFLTIEELKKLMKTDCRYPLVKMAFLFSCFSGLRYSDMKTLCWSHVHLAPDGVNQYIEKKQIKTGSEVVIPLSDEIKRWMPEREEGVDLVFHDLQISHTTVEEVLWEWIAAAGINKYITYHCSRHTAATLLLTLGANLYVVSKLLGHKSIKVTEVYAKIVDKNKIDTMNLVNNIFNNMGV